MDEERASEILLQLERELARGREGILLPEELQDAKNVAHAGVDEVFEQQSDPWRRGNRLRHGASWVHDTLDQPYAQRDDCISILTPWVDFYRAELELPGTVLTRAEVSFRAGERFKAIDAVRRILYRAERSVLVVDNFVDEQIWQLTSDLSTSGAVRVEVLTRQPSEVFLTYLRALLAQGEEVEARTRDDIHDRWIVLDETEVWRVGPSIKDLGRRAGSIARVRAEDVARVVDELRGYWTDAEPLRV